MKTKVLMRNYLSSGYIRRGFTMLDKVMIYKESETELTETDWELWGKRVTPKEEVFVYRKLVTHKEAEQYYEQEALK